MDLETIEDAMQKYEGFCQDCREFTRPQTEPDAEGYDCPQCDGHNVIGAEQGNILGVFDLC